MWRKNQSISKLDSDNDKPSLPPLKNRFIPEVPKFIIPREYEVHSKFFEGENSDMYLAFEPERNFLSARP